MFDLFQIVWQFFYSQPSKYFQFEIKIETAD